MHRGNSSEDKWKEDIRKILWRRYLERSRDIRKRKKIIGVLEKIDGELMKLVGILKDRNQ